MTQTTIAIVLLIAASAFLTWKFVGKKLRRAVSSDDKNCGPDCNCS